MEQCDIGRWVEAEENKRYRTLREAIHTVLVAISTGHWLQCNMILKGGVLLAIRYHSERFTEDIDFSTELKLQKFDEQSFLEELEQNLIKAVENLNYGLDCKIQSHKFDPKNPETTFPTLKLTIGYAYKHDLNSHKRLICKNASTVVKIDYSLNEQTKKVESFKLSDGGTISAYSYTDIVAEKIRAILQQKGRNRYRRQDAYDLYYLFKKFPIHDDVEKKHILDCLIEKSRDRNLEIDINSMSDPETIERSEKEYHQLSSEIEGNLPDFQKVYSTVEDFFRSLPWG